MALPMFDPDKFIQDIQARPEIWMSAHPHHKNKLRVTKQWQEIRKIYPKLSVEELKKRWKNMKDTYRKELKRLPQSRPGVVAENFKSNWRFFDALSFLKDELFFPPKEFFEDGGTTQLEQDKETSNQSVPSPPSSNSEDENPDASLCPLKRKHPSEVREEFLRIEKKKMKILEEELARNNEYMKSDNYHFLMSLLPEMEKLHPLQKMRLRTKISQAVFDEVSMSLYGGQQTYSDEQQMQFQETPIDNVSIEIKEEGTINMYD